MNGKSDQGKSRSDRSDLDFPPQISPAPENYVWLYNAPKTTRGIPMHIRARAVMIAVAAAAALGLAATSTAGQAPPAGLFPSYTAPRTADGKPNLNGIWQAFTTANWDILAHAAQPGPHPELLGAWGAGPGGQSIVEGGEIPYRPEALAKKKEN